MMIAGYQVEDVIGEGAMSVVYRVSRDGEMYALKWMKEQQSSNSLDVLLQFRREAAALARWDHPSLVRVAEVGEEDNRPFLVMELLDGQNVETLVQAGPMDPSEVVAIGRSVASALVEVHRYDLVHRDIKPANIIRNQDGTVKLIDFGLVSGATDDEALVGTLRYAAPEQTGVIKRPIGPATDLYALGASLYECLSGHPAIDDADPSAFLHRMMVEIPKDLREYVPNLRPSLALIVARLLAKDPDDRYQSAAGLLADLERLEQLDADFHAGTLELGSQDRATPKEADVPLCGRDSEVAHLKAGASAAAGGQATVILVEGEEGSGKTKLIRELSSVSSAVLLVGQCQSGEAAPFGPLRSAVDQYVATILRLPEETRTGEMERIRRAAGPLGALLKHFSQGLGRLLADRPDIRALDPDAEQQRYYEVVANFFRNLGESQRPLILVIDDVQWLDEGSMQVVSRMVGVQPAYLMLVAAGRSEPVHRPALLRYREALGSNLNDRIELSPLSKIAIDALVGSRLGGKPVDSEWVDRLATLTHGNPFIINQYLRSLLDNGLLRFVNGVWTAAPSAMEANLTTDVLGMMVARLQRMSAAPARLAAVAALIGRRFEVGLLQAVSGMSLETVRRLLEELIRADLLERVDADTYAFVHDGVRTAAAEKLGTEEQRDVHQSIAEALDQPDNQGNLYAVAHHYAQGHVARNPKRVVERNLAAGLLAVAEHANEQAFVLLDRARELNTGILSADDHLRLLEGLGRACALTGRLDAAFDHLQQALHQAKTQADRFRLQNLLTLSYASQGRNDDALASLMEAFRVLGQPFPQSLGMQILTMLWAVVLGNFLALTGIGYGRAQGAKREQRATLSQLHYTGSMIALFQGNPVLMGQFIVRDFLNVHFLGATGDTAITYSVYGAVLGLAGLSGMVEYYCNKGIKMAESLGDNAALSVCRVYHAVGTKWSGNLVKGNEMLLGGLSALDRYVPGSWYQAMMITEQAYSFLHAGHTQDDIEHIRSRLPQLERTNNLMFRYNTRSVLYCQLAITGQTAEAQPLWEELERQFQPLSRTVYVGLARCIAVLEVLVDREETGPAVDEQIAQFQQLLSEDYYSNAARVLAGYARMNQFLLAPAEQKLEARRQFEREMRGLSLRAMVPVFRCHVFLFRAVLARVDGKHAKAETLLRQAEQLATRAESHRGKFHITVEKARLAAEMGDSVSGYYAQQALDLATSQRWVNKARRLRTEFKIREEKPVIRTRESSTVAAPIRHQQRYADALLQVSLASGSTLDPDAQAQKALEELVKVLNAERALFFLLSDAGELKLTASTGAGAEKISKTIVQKVMDTRAPVVLTGNEKGEVLSSESIVEYGLRSIMAAPLMIRSRLVGVVYVDSRLAKAMFNQEDVNLLLGISNHIAIAVETARTARLEAERAAMARDLEILGVVQNLLLPRTPNFEVPHLQGSSFYQAAAQCGGDWWWYWNRPDGATLILLGDVSGHGAGPAMLTSAVSGTFQALTELFPNMQAPELLEHLSSRVKTFPGYHMTMSMALVDPSTGTLSWWNAGGPEIYLIRGGKVSALSAAGSVLGTPGTLTVGLSQTPIAAGDRVFMCTDGLLEMRRSGRMLGSRQVSKMVAATKELPVAQACTQLGKEVRMMLEGQEQEDDITFVLFEMT